MATKDSPDGAPINPAIRRRGGNAHRLETFVDAAFAFALTLLVISFDSVPASYDELLQALRGVPAFMASFAIIVMVWVAHHRWSRDFGLDNAGSVWISLLLVFVVMVYVYPLRAMMSTAMNVITGGWAPSDFRVGTLAEARGLFTIYGAGFTAITTCICLLYWQALRSSASLALTPFERAITRSEIIIWAMMGAVGVVSIVMAQTLPSRMVGLAGWVYSLLGILAPLVSIRLTKRARRKYCCD